MPAEFKVVGPYARLAYKAQGLPEGSALNASALAGRARIAWHVDRLTLVLPNGTRVVIEARTEVVQIEASGSWITIPPAFIRPSYNVAVKGRATLSALMRYAEGLSRQISRNPPPLSIPPWVKNEMISRFIEAVKDLDLYKSRRATPQRCTRVPFRGLPLIVPPQLWSELNAAKRNSTPTLAKCGRA